MNLEKNSVVVATVTYGNRWKYLKKMLQVVEKMPEVSECIIVSNGSSYNVENFIKELSYEKKIILINNKENLGSAKGYWQVMAEAKKIKNKNLLLLDDDNLPERNIFENLKREGKEKLKNNKNIIAFYRSRYFEKMFTDDSVENITRYRNTFCKFSFLNKMFPKRYSKSKKSSSLFKKCVYSQYSGLLFPISLLYQVNLPNLKYFLYVDDTDFTFRITKAGYNILVYKNGIINEMQYSWSQRNAEEEMDPYKAIFLSKKPLNGFYYIRNRIFFEKKYLVNNELVYWINSFIYLTVTFLFYMPKNKSGLQIFKRILKARKDGIRGILGKMNTQ